MGLDQTRKASAQQKTKPKQTTIETTTIKQTKRQPI